MAWNKRLSLLNDALASLIFNQNDAIPFLRDASINPALINFSGNALAWWSNILTYADGNNRVDALVDALLKQHSQNKDLLSYKEGNTLDYSLGPDIKRLSWHDSEYVSNYEKILSGKSTLLPISTLIRGYEKSKSVCRIVIGDGTGTGFLIEGNKIVTNNHVIPTKEKAQDAVIQFNYEQSIEKIPLDIVTFRLVPDSFFITSPEEEYDFTIVAIDGDANTQFNFLKFSQNPVVAGEFVNIIQHPAGRYKEIGLYNNIVTYVDDNIVQYLTDTERGSSGSPVLNMNWEVVALHHSGGYLREPNSNKMVLRNEGININRLPKTY